MTRRPMLAVRRQASRLTAQRERGSSSIQMVILLPALFSMVFLGMQAALFYQARAVALAAAQEGARAAAAAQGGTTAQGIAAANGYVTSTTIGLSKTAVSGSRSATVARITVSANTLSVIPGWKTRVTQSATLPVERVTGR